METITFQCKVITPMFLAGADGKTPELRAPSIKGAMRFWWRAVNGHLPLESEYWRDPINKKEKPKLVFAGLRTLETAIFGGVGENEMVGQRSSFTLRIPPVQLNTTVEKLVPHKERGFTSEAIMEEETFDVVFQVPDNYSVSLVLHDRGDGRKKDSQIVFDTDRLVALFQITCLLGGFGRRVRRGMGSIKVQKIIGADPVKTAHLSLSDLENLLKKLSPHFTLDESGEKILNTYSGRMEKYPWIKQIQIGNTNNNITYKISDTTHKYKQKDGRKYEPSLGHSFKGRFASPVYVSVGELGVPVITTFNTIPDRDRSFIDLKLQDDFRNTIIK